MGFPIVQTTAYFLNRLTAEINPALAAPTLLSAAKIILGVNPITPSASTVYADLSEATFVGYAASATIVWGTPINETDGSQTAIAPSHLFRATASTTPNQINCFGVTDGVAAPGTGILGSAKIVPYIPIVNTGDGFSLTVAWNTGLNSANSEGTVTA